VGARNCISQMEKSFIKKSLSFIPKNNLKALDLGCGTGRIISLLNKQKKISTIYGIDQSLSMIKYCRGKFCNSPKIKEIILSDISKKLPFKDNSFDLITAIRALKYNQNWEETLTECFRILKKGGVLIFDMPNQNSIYRFSHFEIPIYRTTFEHLKKALKSKGFKIIAQKGGTILPAFIYNHLKKGIFLNCILFTERAFKKFFGEIFLSRYLYFTCQKDN
jgi:ubiquinone/menaquinone biosynthesis C-methylase UbiE